ncbi:MAG: epsE [Gammaproteobacteria bacterium]|jgi:polysaccharide export outer membrane protein|nr:epsE [Gammaproteobacteria bacterium]
MSTHPGSQSSGFQRFKESVHKRLGLIALFLLWTPQLGLAQASAGGPNLAAPATSSEVADDRPLLQLGPGDQVKMDVFGRPEMDSTMYISDDGKVRVPLAGPVAIAGLSPTEAAQKVETALRDGQFLVDPHVTFSVIKSLSQRVSVLGEVKVPGRYPIESDTTVLDLLALAGGRTEKGSDVIVLLRQSPSGAVERYPINLEVAGGHEASPEMMQKLRGGDRVFVPESEQFFVSGEVHTPAAYRLEAGTTVLEALARAGGVTDRGSARRVYIRRRDASGKYVVTGAKPGDKVQANDVITVKERIF